MEAMEVGVPVAIGAGDGHAIATPFEIMVRHISRYLHLNDLKAFRLVNSVFNDIVSRHPAFVQQSVGTISTKFYTLFRGANRNNRIAFKYFRMNHFAYHRNIDIFRLFWRDVGQTITHLTLSNSSFECDGFSFILNHLPILHSLALVGIKLRDLDNLHAPHLLRDGQPDRILPPNHCYKDNIRQPLKHLTFDSMNYIENCFLDYLVERTSALESITVASCFLPTTTNAYVHRQRGTKTPMDVPGEVVNEKMVNDAVEHTKLQALFDQFKYYLKSILDKSGAHIRKVKLTNNFRQSELIPLFTSTHTLVLNDLTLDVRHEERPGRALFGPTVVDPVPIINALISSRGRMLQKLSLDFFKRFTIGQLTALLTPAEAFLQEIKISYDHSLLASGEILNFGILQRMVNLEKFELSDKTAVSREDKKQFLSHKTTEDQRVEIRDRLNSKVSMDFTTNLPNSMSALKLQSIQSPANYLDPPTPAERAQLLASFGNLSSLEIKGPWLHPDPDLMLKSIFQHLRQLNRLSLVNCGIKDKHLTSLSHNTVRELRKSNMLLLPVHIPEPGFGDPFPYLNPVLENGVPKPNLGDMNVLRHLDLSENLSVTIVTIGYSLPRLPQLKSLGLSSCHNVNDGGLTLIAYYLRNLEELNVKHVRRITQIGLNHVIDGCKKLRRLFVSKKISHPIHKPGRRLEGYKLMKAGGWLNLQLHPHYHEIILPSEEADPMEGEPSDHEHDE